MRTLVHAEPFSVKQNAPVVVMRVVTLFSSHSRVLLPLEYTRWRLLHGISGRSLLLYYDAVGLFLGTLTASDGWALVLFFFFCFFSEIRPVCVRSVIAAAGASSQSSVASVNGVASTLKTYSRLEAPRVMIDFVPT